MAESRAQVPVLPRGLGGLGGPVQQAGGEWRRHGRRAVLPNIPALPETTDLPPNPRPPISPSTPRATHAVGNPAWASGRTGVEGEMQAG